MILQCHSPKLMFLLTVGKCTLSHENKKALSPLYHEKYF